MSLKTCQKIANRGIRIELSLNSGLTRSEVDYLARTSFSPESMFIECSDNCLELTRWGVQLLVKQNLDLETKLAILSRHERTHQVYLSCDEATSCEQLARAGASLNFGKETQAHLVLPAVRMMRPKAHFRVSLSKEEDPAGWVKHSAWSGIFSWIDEP